MAIRTYIPAILIVAEYLKKFVNKHSVVLQERLGDGLYALVVLVVDLLIIVASLINQGHTPGDQWSDFNSIETFPANAQDQIAAAIAKFYASIGVTP